MREGKPGGKTAEGAGDVGLGETLETDLVVNNETDGGRHVNRFHSQAGARKAEARSEGGGEEGTIGKER